MGNSLQPVCRPKSPCCFDRASSALVFNKRNSRAAVKRVKWDFAIYDGKVSVPFLARHASWIFEWIFPFYVGRLTLSFSLFLSFSLSYARCLDKIFSAPRVQPFERRFCKCSRCWWIFAVQGKRHRLLIIVNSFINNRSCRSSRRRRVNIASRGDSLKIAPRWFFRLRVLPRVWCEIRSRLIDALVIRLEFLFSFYYSRTVARG